MNADAPEALTRLISRRLESRYRRICFVQRELAKINAEAQKQAASGIQNAGSFGDLVFGAIDFSIYGKIDAEEFSLVFEDGLGDFDEDFYRKAFNTDRESVRQTISRSYFRAGPFYVCKKPNPLILSVMRSVHTSLDFAPLFTMDDLAGAGFHELVRALDGVTIRHRDGMETRLFVPKEEHETALLCGTFYPEGKAHTIPLIRGGIYSS